MQNLRLTYPQQNIWLVEKTNSNLPINSIVGTIEINEGFNEEICNEAINWVIKNNDAMRINIVNIGDQTYQKINGFKYRKFEVINLSLCSENEKKEYINDSTLLPLFLEKTGEDRFNNLEDYNDLYDFKILDYGNDSGAIFMKIHHIISDAWSCSKIGTQLIEYMEKKKNYEEIIEEVKPSYVEFAQKEIEYENSDKFVKDGIFWEEYLNGIHDAISLSNKSSDIFDTNAKRYNVKLDEDLNEKINVYCKENKISPFALFMSALSTYIYRVKEKEDFVIGTPLLNRSNFKEKQMLGMFISTIPMRIKMSNGISFVELAKEISKNNLEIFRHQKYPYAKILENVRKTTNVKSNLYNIILSYQNARTDMIKDDVYSTTWPFVNHVSDELQIHVMDMDSTGVLNINYDYKTSLFSDIEIKYLHERIMAIIENALEDINVNVEDIAIMSKSEEDKILKEFNNTLTDYTKDKTLIEIFEEQVKITPEKIAIEFDGNTITYSELNKRANKLAKFLHEEKNVKINDIVGVMINKSFELVISILACLKCGAAYLPIEKNYPKDRILYMVNNSNCNLILVDSFGLEFDNYTNILNVKEVLNKYELVNNINYDDWYKVGNEYSADSIVYIMYTSGTTGIPKGVCVTNRNIMRLVKNTNYIEFFEDDVIIQTGATVFDASTFEIWGALLNGLALHLIKKDDLLNPKYLENYLEKNNITIMWLTAPLFNQMVDYNVNMFKNLRVLLVGGDVLSVKHVNKVIDCCPKVQIINGYGPTENTTFSMCYLINEKFESNIPIGKPISNSFGYVVDSKLRLLPMFVKGELLVGGDGVSKGYLNDEKKTSESFVQDPFNNGNIAYKTGDIVRLNENGVLEFYGRKDNQFKIRGFRIELEEIKLAISSLEYIKDVFVMARKDKNDEYKIYTYYVLNDENKIKNDRSNNISNDSISNNELNYDIRYDLQDKIPNYMLPSFYINVEKIPLNQNGKVDKEALILQTPIQNEDIDFVSEVKNKPSTNLQVEISNIVTEILDISEVQIDTTLSLFNFGMDSLSAIKLAIELSNKYNVEVSAKDIFEKNTILALEEYIKNAKSDNLKNIQTTEKIENEIYPLSDMQEGIFIECMKNPDVLSYNVPFEFIIENKNECEYDIWGYDINYIKECLVKLVSVNEVFFTKFFTKDNNIYQKINLCDNEKVIKNIEIKENLSQEEFKKYKNEFVRNFNLLEDTLYRIAICKIKDAVDEKIHILFDIHHIIFDGSSIVILLKEFEQILSGNSLKVKEAVLGKKANVENNLKNTSSYIETKKCILEKLKNNLIEETAVSNIPYDFTFVKDKEKKTSASEEFVLNKEEKEILESFAKQNNITLNTLFLSAFSIILSKYSNSSNILLGMASSSRKTKEELENIGMFVKTLLINFKIDYTDKLNEFLDKVQKEIIDVTNNDLITYKELAKSFWDEKIYLDNMLKTMYIYQNMASDKTLYKNIKLNELDVNVAKFDFVCQVIPYQNKIKIKLEYNNSLYLKSTIKRFGSELIYLLTKLKDYASDKVNLSKIDILPEIEKDILLSKFNDTVTNYPKYLSISQVFENEVRKNPDAIALVFEDKVLSYSDLNKLANKFARYLKEKLEVTNNQVISIVADKSFEMVIGILGILKSGACYLPIDFNLPEERIIYMVECSDSKVVINCSDKNLNFVKDELFDVDIIDIKKINYFNYDGENLANSNTQNDLAYIMYTSGSTGKPKGCMNTHRGVIKLVKDINYLDIEKIENVFLAGNLVFDASLHEMWLCLLNGKTGVIIKKEDVLTPSMYKAYFEKYNNILAIFTTQLFHQYAKSMPDIFKNSIYVICGGDVLLYEYVEKVKKCCKNTNVINIYGPAECSAAATTFNVNELKNKKTIPIGRPISNTRCYVLDSTLNLCPINVAGELYIGGDGVGKGYINNTSQTDKVFIKNNIDSYSEKLYKTGDVVKWNEDGTLEFLGREDRQVKIRGYRVEIAEIENIALSFDDIKEVKVILKEFELDKKLVMYYTSNTKVDFKELKFNMMQKLPSYMVPEYFIQIDKMPLTLNGKIDIKNLPKLTKIDNITEFIPPRNDVEKRLSKIICKLLNLEKISINANLLDSGLDSINITRFCIEAMNYKLNVTYSDVFEYPTIEELAKLINDNTAKEYNYNIEEYDYTKIKDLLNRKVVYEENIIKDVLITGVNGFLGAHVLAEYLDNFNGVAYCVVRGKGNISGRERLKSILKYYFKDKYDFALEKRIKVIDVEISSSKFEKILNELLPSTSVNKIINCAAKVKHYGKFEEFYKLNVESVKKLISVSLKNNIKLVHVSTLSVSGNGIEGGFTSQDLEENIKFTEKDLYVGQKINNVYSYSKFLAEREILENVINNSLQATIIRVGNLMGRYSDGKFQRNKNENAFTNRIKFLVENKIITEDIAKNSYVEFSPIDLTAKAVLKMANYEKCDYIYHLYNYNHYKMIDLLGYFRNEKNIEVKVLSDEQFYDKLEYEIKKSSSKFNSIIITDLNSNKKLDYSSSISIEHDVTTKMLDKINFKWNIINNEYLNKFFKELNI